ncbi:MAG: hypothetical protein VBE63_17720 [Lamprobacter sp.]|uniref:hypothetical protein n=1 Tax=Lamprobacter sp. TaxID=3100796 RepID=UPI002B261B56|nr:hypothetical protein [Lamprobacter sp.]MEA3641755.1 hypothetical protein [Lamprobacter sp.]
MNVAAYLRKTLTGLSVSAQRERLHARGEEFDWNLIFYGFENGADCENGITRDRGLQDFLTWVCYRAPVRVKGVMFWHAGHIAGSLSGFIKALQVIDACKLEWYIENPRISSQSDTGKQLLSLSADIRGIDTEITQLNLRERSADMKLRGTNPGKTKITRQAEGDIIMLKRNGRTIRQIAHDMKLSYGVVQRVLKENPI